MVKIHLRYLTHLVKEDICEVYVDGLFSRRRIEQRKDKCAVMTRSVCGLYRRYINILVHQTACPKREISALADVALPHAVRWRTAGILHTAPA